jgi:hypothetical protein
MATDALDAARIFPVALVKKTALTPIADLTTLIVRAKNALFVLDAVFVACVRLASTEILALTAINAASLALMVASVATAELEAEKIREVTLVATATAEEAAALANDTCFMTTPAAFEVAKNVLPLEMVGETSPIAL